MLENIVIALGNKKTIMDSDFVGYGATNFVGP